MSWLGRAFGILLIVLILIVTPFAFWVYNIDRVAMDPQTYKAALTSQHFYDNLLPALVDAVAADKSSDPTAKTTAQALINNMSPDDWTVVSQKLLPTTWLQQQLTGNIDRFFDWLSGSESAPDIHFELQILKTNLTGTGAHTAAQIIVPKLPTCTDAQEQIFKDASASSTPNAPVMASQNTPLICNPASSDYRTLEVNTLTGVFQVLGNNLPTTWNLVNEMHKAASVGQGPAEVQLTHLRAAIWLNNQLIILLFLIPVALFSLIIIVTIRSAKSLFRWFGWVLILSGLITLVPVPFLTPAMFNLVPAMQTNIHNGFGASGGIFASLIGGMISSILAGLTLAVLIQVVIVIVVGFVAVFISVLLPAPEPNVTREEIISEQTRLAAEGVTPYWLASAPTYGHTPPPSLTVTPPPQAAGSTPNTPRPVDPDTYIVPPGAKNAPPVQGPGQAPESVDDLFRPAGGTGDTGSRPIQ